MKRSFSRKNLWDAAPAFVRNGVGRLFRILPPALLLGRRFRESLALVRSADRWSEDQIRDHQATNLRRICSLAYSKTPFYRRLFDGVGFHPNDIRSPDDIVALPTIDRKDVIEHLDEMCAVSPSSAGVDFVESGGTSGLRLGLYMHRSRSAVEYAHLVAGWERAGFRLGMPKAVLRKRCPEPDRSNLRHEYDPLLREHYYSTFHMSDSHMAQYIAHIATIGDCFLHVYPSAVAMLARFMRATQIQMPLNIRGILAESEMVYPDQRDYVCTVFSVRYFSSYGHSEKLVAAAECEGSTDYHVYPTYGYAEILDGEGHRVNVPGRRGEIVGTGFINSVTPLIRYRTGDSATFVGHKCNACGREHLIVRDILGHQPQEMLVARDGSLIPWVTLDCHDDTFDKVWQIQFCQKVPGQAALRIVGKADFSPTDSSRIQEHLAHRLGDRLRVTVELCDTIPLSPSGKAVHVEQHITAAESPLLHSVSSLSESS